MKHYIITAAAIVLLSSCASKIPINKSVIEQYNLGENELKSLQYWVSNDITLVRGEKKDEQKSIDESGKVVISSATTMDQVLIPKNTPGVCIKVYGKEKIAVSFETDDKYLVFGDVSGRGRFTLLAAEWKDGRGTLDYGGQVYYAQPGAASTYLLIKLKKIKKYKKQARVVKGRKV